MKLFISGPSGSGKSTLARYLAEKYDLFNLVGSSKVLWDKYNIKSHADLIYKCEQDIDFGIKFQYELLELRMELIGGKQRWVMDRGVLDNLVYFALQLSHKITNDQFERYYRACIHTIEIARAHTLLLNPAPLENLENDGARIDNYWYQDMTYGLFKHYSNKIVTDSKTFTCDPIVNWNWSD